MPAPSEAHQASGSGTDSVDFVRFKSRHTAEHMVASLGRDFRKKARKGKTTAFIATHNRDGSFKLVQSRVLTGTGIASTAIHVTASVMVGFLGSIASLKGAKAATHAARQRKSHTGREDQELAELLDHLGPKAACVLFHCMDEDSGQVVARLASRHAGDSWHYSRVEFLELLDRLGSNYDWIRPAVAEPTSKMRKHSKTKR